MKRDLLPESAAILALDTLVKHLQSSDMPTDANDTKRSLDSLINQSLQYLTHGDLRADGVFICVDCACLFEPWHDADEHECDTCQKCSNFFDACEQDDLHSYNNR